VIDDSIDMKMRFKSLILASAAAGSLFLCLPAQAQVFTPQSTGNTGGNTGGGPQNTNTVVTEQQGGNDPVMGNVVPMFNPGSGEVLYEGQLWNISNNPAFNARFQKYLNSPPATGEEDQKYRATMEAIRDALSPHRKPDIRVAVRLLEQAASFGQDDRMCEALANLVYRVSLARNQMANIDLQSSELRKQRKIEVRNAQISAEGNRLRAPSDGDDGGDEPARADDTVGTLSELGEYATRYAEIQAMIVANQANNALTKVESRLEFQALIVQLLLQRRFEHVIVGTRLYTEFFQDGAGRLEFEEGSDVQQLSGQTVGFDPTITGAEAFALEMIQDTDDAVEAFDLLISQDERSDASQRLMEAFMIGEHMPSIQTVSLEKKQSIKEFVREYNQLLAALSSKNFTQAEANVDRLNALGTDFDASRPAQAIQTVKFVSRQHIDTAMNAALEGDRAASAKHIAAATELWPTNPYLEEAFTMMSKNGNRQFQTLIQLDSLIQTRSFRQVFEDSPRYLAACADDEERLENVMQIIQNIQKIESAVESANRIGASGNSYGAWETLEEFYIDFPDDPKLSKARNDMMTKVAPFVNALSEASDREDRGETGSSLAWYLKSQQMYPLSTFAKEGIDRLVEEILPQQAPSPTSL
jgi:hypothetical protein